MKLIIWKLFEKKSNYIWWYTPPMTPETNSILMIIKLEYIILLFLILLKSFDMIEITYHDLLIL